MPRTRRKITVILFILYSALMVYLLFLQRIHSFMPWPPLKMIKANLNLIPFHTIRELTQLIRHNYNGYLWRFSVFNLAGNVAAFVPLGFFLPCLWKKQRTLWRFLLTAVLIIAAIELIQVFTLLGSCDIDDLILNISGTLMGFAAYRITAAAASGKSK